jgi:HAD superfamily phosphoserine phosphatase-like hydrolase
MAIQLVAFDLDGTLTRDHSCVQAIAHTIGRAEECAEFERLEMRDEARVRAAREAMADWYRAYSLQELVTGLKELTLAPGTEEAFARLHECGVTVAIVSITWSFAVEWFARRLGADHAHGTRLTPAGIEHFWPAEKGAWLSALAARLHLASGQVAAVGDSDGDRELLVAAGARFFVGHRPPDLDGVVHLPDANLLTIADRILQVP